MYDVNVFNMIAIIQHAMLPVGECRHSIGRTTAGVFNSLAGFSSFKTLLSSALSLAFTFNTAVR